MQAYINTDRKIHWLSQEITKVLRAYLSHKEDDSHTNLAYDELGNRIVGQWIGTPHEKLLFTLVLEPLQFVWVNHQQQVKKEIAVKGKNIVDIKTEIKESLIGYGLDEKLYHQKLHYEIPDYGFTQSLVEGIPDEGLIAWAKYRSLANHYCLMVSEFLQTPSDIRIWPHHFDTGINLKLNSGLHIGFGLAMEDNMVGSPYFYITGYDTRGQIRYENLPSLQQGQWNINKNWKGGILPLNELENVDMENKTRIIKSFLLKSLQWFLQQ